MTKPPEPRVFSLDGYQRLTRRTIGDATLPILALGVAGEAGEVADLVKKAFGHGHPLDFEKLAEELGDVLFYVAALADAAGASLSDVANFNVEKLRRRYPDGFSTERSLNREGEP